MAQYEARGADDVRIDRRLNQIEKKFGIPVRAYKPSKYAKYDRCVKCGGLVIMPCILCNPPLVDSSLV